MKNLYLHNPSFPECVSLHNLVYHLIGNVPDRRNAIYSNIQSGLEDLNNNNYIKIKDTQQKHYLLDCSNLCFDTNSGNFSKITFEEVIKIFQIKTVNQYCLLRYFILLMGTLMAKITVSLPNGNSKSSIISNLPISYLAKQMNVSTKTIMDYNKSLEDAKLIYVYRQNDFIQNEDSSIKSLPNIYGRYEDKEYIEIFASNQRKHQKSYLHTYEKNNNTNQKRRLAQMYQNICKGKYTSYSEEEIIDVYNYVVSENKRYEEIYNKTQYDGYLDKIRNTDVFKQFEFTCEKNIT